MAIEFYGDIINEYEQKHNKAYVGYFSPEGALVDYNSDTEESHTYLDNVVAWTFLLWVKNSKVFEDFNFKNKDMKIKFDLANPNNKNKNILMLQRDLLKFLSLAEKDPNFMKILKTKIDFSKIPDYDEVGNNIFGKYNTRELLFFLKDICIQYLGYDSIEQVSTDAHILDFHKHSENSTYIEKPRIITTTSINIYERFYNYLLMNWKVQRVPRFIYNEKTTTFDRETHEMFEFQSEKDISCEEEIKSIKKLVPLKERQRFFR